MSLRICLIIHGARSAVSRRAQPSFPGIIPDGNTNARHPCVLLDCMGLFNETVKPLASRD